MRHLEKYNKQDLIQACELKGLDTGGDMEILIARLESRGSPEVPAEPVAEPEPETE